ncbi:hypothetical protein [Coleofasciculus sp. FACHB-1120]|uniref:hypothetical protein n=1 Tax=Coleofasciculus sp. FACHB-1120 TaxID=2692783 RepID=UPI0016831316|nr:hypothetical protein [Coleofasciculus sp. FACHB-1120]MBD2741349.1 hypothetical protein [Coleofasciculus sp. FACHB-1120]
MNHKARKEVETVISIVLERGGEYFRELRKSLTDSDRNLLQSLVYKEAIAHQDTMILQTKEDG